MREHSLISVIVPIYKVQDYLDECIESIIHQTYSNIEYWISDGSSNKEKSEEIKTFCEKYNVNYHSLKRPSVNKADNLNHFLKYLMVSHLIPFQIQNIYFHFYYYNQKMYVAFYHT